MVQQRRFDEIYDDLVDVWKKMEADTLAFKNLLDELCKANYANNMNQSPQSGLSQSNNFDLSDVFSDAEKDMLIDMFDLKSIKTKALKK